MSCSLAIGDRVPYQHVRGLSRPNISRTPSGRREEQSSVRYAAVSKNLLYLHLLYLPLKILSCILYQ